MRTLATLLTTAVLVAASGLVFACSDDTSEELEDVGEEIQDVGDEAGDLFEDETPTDGPATETPAPLQ